MNGLRPSSWGTAVLLLVLGCAQKGALAQDHHASAQERAATLAPDEPQWRVPTLHAGGVVLGSRVALSVLWPEAFDPTAVTRNRRQFAQSWSSWPAWDQDAALF
ncbi:MAG: hypothetical protein AAFS10_26645, partial [Myxococcota bacterium]